MDKAPYLPIVGQKLFYRRDTSYFWTVVQVYKRKGGICYVDLKLGYICISYRWDSFPHHLYHQTLEEEEVELYV